MNDFVIRARSLSREKETIVCAGLDPDIARIPGEYSAAFRPEHAIVEFLKKFVDLTVEHVCAYKIQKAFFDYYAAAHSMLSEVVAHIRASSCAPVILDCKIGDISSTMDIYLKTCFEVFQIDAVVINPYMGPDVWRAFQRFPDKAAAVLVRTSGSSSGVLQDALLADGRTVWQYVLDLVVTEWRSGAAVVPILSDSPTRVFRGLRASIPSEMSVFLAGVGAQGGTGGTVRDLVDGEGLGVIVNSSRALLYPYERDAKGWAQSVERAVVGFKNQLNGYRG